MVLMSKELNASHHTLVLPFGLLCSCFSPHFILCFLCLLRLLDLLHNSFRHTVVHKPGEGLGESPTNTELAAAWYAP